MTAIIPSNSTNYKKFKRFLTQLSLYAGSIVLAITLGYQVGYDKSQSENKLSDEIYIRNYPEDAVPLSQYNQIIANSNDISEIKENENVVDNPQESRGGEDEIVVVASKSGSKYYFSWCSGLSRVSEENRIYFENEAEAQEAGLERATNCELNE